MTLLTMPDVETPEVQYDNAIRCRALYVPVQIIMYF